MIINTMGLLTTTLLRTAIGYIFYQANDVERYKVVALCVIAVMVFEGDEIRKVLFPKKK